MFMTCSCLYVFIILQFRLMCGQTPAGASILFARTNRTRASAKALVFVRGRQIVAIWGKVA